ncbi:MAG: XisI protein [Acidobacteria bacterium]|nr:XisI protein [Acidobacteriota bacterium]
MDSTNNQLNQYRAIIEQTLTDIANYIPQDNEAPHKTLFDRNADSYGVIEVGWDDYHRVHQFIIHVELINGKVWVQADNTDLNVTRELERAGIPKSAIVLGFHSPSVRPFTEYAIA